MAGESFKEKLRLAISALDKNGEKAERDPGWANLTVLHYTAEHLERIDKQGKEEVEKLNSQLKGKDDEIKRLQASLHAKEQMEFLLVEQNRALTLQLMNKSSEDKGTQTSPQPQRMMRMQERGGGGAAAAAGGMDMAIVHPYAPATAPISESTDDPEPAALEVPTNRASSPQEVVVRRRRRKLPKCAYPVKNERGVIVGYRWPHWTEHPLLKDKQEEEGKTLRRQRHRIKKKDPSSSTVEVPKWRLVEEEGLGEEEEEGEVLEEEEEEDVSEAAVLRRHARHEQDEKRRKRWDSQRVREETYLERLKRRQEERENQKQRRKAARKMAGGGIGEDKESDEDNDGKNEDLIDQIQFIRVGDDLPTFVFGVPLPPLTQREFRLPKWENLGIGLEDSPPASPSDCSSLLSIPDPAITPYLEGGAGDSTGQYLLPPSPVSPSPLTTTVAEVNGNL